jgi:hypothetical protein|tara:strand:- start:1331 stop:1531 length:201 start_codon:yes stop_codon:yes gene_type:complete
MSIAMFIVGGSIFIVYVAFLIWNISYGSRKQREENYPGYYSRHSDLQDYDGMGNYGRFPNKKEKQK